MNTEKPAVKAALPGRTCAVTASDAGAGICLRIAEALDPAPDLYITKRLARPGFTPVKSLSSFFETAFAEYDTIICVMASGIVVRAAAPLLRHKSEDPALLVLDSAGRYVISLLSGHLGGANRSARIIAGVLGAEPVITTATDSAGIPAADTIAQSAGCVFEDFDTAKEITALMLEGREILLVCDKKNEIKPELELPENITVLPELPDEIPGSCAGMMILSETVLSTLSEEMSFPAAVLPVLICRPKDITVGIGCRRGTSAETILAQIEKACGAAGTYSRRAARLATIGLKAEEPGLVEAARRLDAELAIVPDDAVRELQNRFEGSDFVERTTGLRCVAEPCGAAVSGGRRLGPVLKENGVTVSLWRPDL